MQSPLLLGVGGGVVGVWGECGGGVVGVWWGCDDWVQSPLLLGHT